MRTAPRRPMTRHAATSGTRTISAAATRNVAAVALTSAIGTALILAGLVGLVMATTLSGCGATPHHADHARQWQSVARAVAVLRPTAGSDARGTVTFTQQGPRVMVKIDMEGLVPGHEHAIHIHQWGDLRSVDGTAAGGHFNPTGHPHGLPAQTDRHAGDLGNLKADGAGRASHAIVVDNISVAGIKSPVIGRGVIVHAHPDDGGQPTGNAGARLAQGVIGIVEK